MQKKDTFNSDHFVMLQVIHRGYYLNVFLKIISSKHLPETIGREEASLFTYEDSRSCKK